MRPTRSALTALVTLALAASAPAAASAVSAPAPAAASAFPAAARPVASAASAIRTAAPAPAARLVASASCGAPGGPLFGITRIDGRRTVARFGPRTLRPLRAPRVRVPLRVIAADSAFSPGCDAVALRVHRGRVVLVDLRRGLRTASLTLAGRAAVGRLAWPRSDRLTGFVGPHLSQRVVTVSVPGGRVVAAHRVGGRPWTSEATSLGMVMLAGPADRVGPVTLVLAGPDGGILRAPLSRISAGYDDHGPRAPARLVTPGLAVDEAAARAYVVAASEPLVAEVDLASGAVTYHGLPRGGASPVPRAADRVPSGPFRVARWLGDGTIAVAGGDIRPRRNWRRLFSGGLPPTTIVPDGLRLIRTDDWSVTTLDPLISRFAPSGGALVGMRSLGDAPATGLTALAVFAPGERRLVRLAGIRPNGLVGAAWPYAYVTAPRPRRTRVVDLRNGRTVTTILDRRPPALLAPWAALSAG